MPIIKSAIKRAKQTIKRRDRNVGIKREIKDATKTFMTKPTAETLSAAQSEIDTAVKKGLIKKNTAARRKSQLSTIAKAAGVKLKTTKKVKTVVAKSAAKPTVKKATAPAKKPVAAKKVVAKKPVAKKATK